MHITRTYKGIDLIDKIVEFIEMTPDSKLWSETALKNNNSRLIRLKQIKSLISAFLPFEPSISEKIISTFSGQKVNLQTILNGEFIERLDIIEYSEVLSLIRSENDSLSLSSEIDHKDLKNVFEKLIQFKKHIRTLLEFNAGWVEVSRLSSYFTIRLTNEISSNLIGKHNELDRVIELMINPKQLSFTEDVLISKFNFPNENLDDIDAENW
jgi:hypothetical protein